MKPTIANLLIFALVLLVAVAVLNLAQNLQSLAFGQVGYELPRVGIDPGGLDLGINPLVIAWVLSLLGLGIFVAAYLWFRPRTGRFPWGEFLPLIVGALLFVSILLLVEPNVDPTREEEEEEGGTIPAEGPQAGEETNTNPLTRLFRGDLRLGPEALALVLAFLAFAAIYLLLATFRTHSARAAAEVFKRERELREGMTSVLEARIYSLALGGDIRSAILGAYRDMVNLFRSYGLRTRKHQTAREVEMLAFESLGLSGKASQELRRGFEEARYSVHPLTEDHREAAIESLRRVQRELGA